MGILESQNEPPYKKQRKSDSTGSILPNTPPQSQTSMVKTIRNCL